LGGVRVAHCGCFQVAVGFGEGGGCRDEGELVVGGAGLDPGNLEPHTTQLEVINQPTRDDAAADHSMLGGQSDPRDTRKHPSQQRVAAPGCPRVRRCSSMGGRAQS
jgi:hypothetical protein